MENTGSHAEYLAAAMTTVLLHKALGVPDFVDNLKDDVTANITASLCPSKSLERAVTLAPKYHCESNGCRLSNINQPVFQLLVG